MISFPDTAVNFPDKSHKLQVVMDTDIANEVDDHFALCELLLSPERFDVKAVIAAPYLHERVKTHEEGMEKSFDELHHIFELMNRSDKDIIFKGSRQTMQAPGKAVVSAGAQRIVELAHDAKKNGEMLYIIGIAAATDIASALLLAPEIADSIIVCWLGGHPQGPWQNNEFNLAQDFFSSQHLFSSNVPLIQFPCRNVAQMLSLSKCELEMRYNGNALLDYLRERTIAEMNFSGNASRPIWDAAPVAWLLDDTPFISEVLAKPLLAADGTEKTAENVIPFRRIASLRRDPIMEQLLSILKQA